MTDRPTAEEVAKAKAWGPCGDHIEKQPDDCLYCAIDVLSDAHSAQSKEIKALRERSWKEHYVECAEEERAALLEKVLAEREALALENKELKERIEAYFMSHPDGVRKDNALLKQQRDQLAEALRGLVNENGGQYPKAQAWKAAREALAAHSGGSYTGAGKEGKKP